MSHYTSLMTGASFFFDDAVYAYPSIGLPIPAIHAPAITTSTFWSCLSPLRVKTQTHPRRRRAFSIGPGSIQKFEPSWTHLRTTNTTPPPIAQRKPIHSAGRMDVAINGRVGRGEWDALENGKDTLGSWKTRALAFGLACVFTHLITESQISTPTPNTALGRGTLWLVARKGTGRDWARATGTTGRARTRSWLLTV
ncbi:hypothetical protein B0H13DRAFT_2561664 [Mycena leptocephala]|nr:hypothetical protein B0H13DRAFT_2561664 [Mycena leptocephala]